MVSLGMFDIMSREEFHMGFQSVKGSSGISVRKVLGGVAFPWRLLRFTSAAK